MSQSGIDLSKLFGAAMNAVNENRSELNSMDEENHPNHGDNVYNNLGVIKNTLQSQQGQNPSDALRAAAEAVAKDGRGSTSQHYAQGLQQAANQFEGKGRLDHNDVASLLTSMLGAGVQQPSQQATAGDPISSLLSLVASQQPQQAAAQPAGTQNLVSKAVPAAMEFMRAKQAGASTPAAAIQAAMGVMSSRNPMQTGSSRGASNGLIAQGVMQALMSSLG
ncbi:MAG: DAK2 domain-containing protein [Candidatus Bathyarchaeia archaeon]|jgi:hypothetical protein